MTRRTDALAAILSTFGALGAACAVSGGGGSATDASVGPPPDAIVLGGDGPAQNDVTTQDGPVSKSCMGLPDGTLCGPSPDVCHDPPVCASGTCAPASTKADGFNWQAGDSTARCCGGDAVHTSTDTNCGVCGIQCNASNGESCQTLAGEWFCRGCVASDACWSHCCSQSFTPYSCAASDCNGNCDPSLCPDGSHCVSGGTTSSDYCSY